MGTTVTEILGHTSRPKTTRIFPEDGIYYRPTRVVIPYTQGKVSICLGRYDDPDKQMLDGPLHVHLVHKDVDEPVFLTDDWRFSIKRVRENKRWRIEGGIPESWRRELPKLNPKKLRRAVEMVGKEILFSSIEAEICGISAEERVIAAAAKMVQILRKKRRRDALRTS